MQTSETMSDKLIQTGITKKELHKIEQTITKILLNNADDVTTSDGWTEVLLKDDNLSIVIRELAEYFLTYKE